MHFGPLVVAFMKHSLTKVKPCQPTYKYTDRSSQPTRGATVRSRIRVRVRVRVGSFIKEENQARLRLA